MAVAFARVAAPSGSAVARLLGRPQFARFAPAIPWRTICPHGKCWSEAGFARRFVDCRSKGDCMFCGKTEKEVARSLPGHLPSAGRSLMRPLVALALAVVGWTIWAAVACAAETRILPIEPQLERASQRDLEDAGRRAGDSGRQAATLRRLLHEVCDSAVRAEIDRQRGSAFARAGARVARRQQESLSGIFQGCPRAAAEATVGPDAQGI